MRKKLILTTITLLALIISSIVFARTINKTSVQTDLPLKFNTGNSAPYGLPSTIISIQGKSIPIIFDTGAKKSEITLSSYALTGLHVKFTGNRICFKTFNGKQCEKEFIIPELILGSFVLQNVKGTLMPKLWSNNETGFVATEASKDGVIGYNLLSEFNFLLDYPHAKAVLYRKGKHPGQFNFSQWTSIPFVGQPFTKLLINGKAITLGWDTGSVPSIIKASAVSNMPTAKCPKDTPYGKHQKCQRIITDNFSTTEGGKLPSTWFSIENIPSFAPFDGLIGSNFYRKNLVYFDFDAHNIYVSTANRAINTSDTT